MFQSRCLFLFTLCSVLSACGGDGNSQVNISGPNFTFTSGNNPASQPMAARAPVANVAAKMSDSRGFSSVYPWVTYYGTAKKVNLADMTQIFRIINIDADPDNAAFSPLQISALKAGGNNKVLSYLDIGSCENYRSYWATAPGFVSCQANKKAQLGKYSNYSNEEWMNPANPDYQNLMINYVAPRLVAQGVDGFVLDNMEIVEHPANSKNGPCDKACSQGGLDLVRLLRAKYPNMLIVMNGATSDITLKGTTGGVTFPSLLDGVIRESVYTPSYDSTGEAQLLAWKALKLTPGGKQFFIGTLDYVAGCESNAKASEDYQKSQTHGFSPYASSNSLQKICYWSF